eukprot:3868270-Lingulodinium_polyedra.AAC.1
MELDRLVLGDGAPPAAAVRAVPPPIVVVLMVGTHGVVLRLRLGRRPARGELPRAFPRGAVGRACRFHQLDRAARA